MFVGSLLVSGSRGVFSGSLAQSVHVLWMIIESKA